VEVDHVNRHWLLPDDGDLLGMLGHQADVSVEAMHALVGWAGGDAGAADEVRACEHRADEAKRELWRALRDAFSPPIDAEDLFTLSADLDEVVNGAKDLVREMEVMDMAPDAPMLEISELLTEAVTELRAAFAGLGRKAEDPTVHADAAVKSQRRVERVYRSAMSELLQLDELREVVGRREAYRRLGRIADQIHRVAERVWYAQMKEA
jgi:uncharacterized protein Yka (UPF0111/DUF47 family)